MHRAAAAARFRRLLQQLRSTGPITLSGTYVLTGTSNFSGVTASRRDRRDVLRDGKRYGHDLPIAAGGR